MSIPAVTLKQLDESGITPFHLKVMFVSGMGFFTDAYDLFIIGVVISLLKSEWGLSTFQTSLLSSTTLLASAIGALIFGRVADLFGRRRIYGFEVLVLAIGAIASAFTPNVFWLVAARFVLGVGVGGDYPVSATIMSEYAGKRSRGMLVGLVFSMQAAGLIVGPLVAVLLLSTGLSHDVIWRILLALGAIPALSVFYLRRQIQETPRFALHRNDANEFSRGAAHVLGARPSVSPAHRGESRPSPSWSEGLQLFSRNRKFLRWLIGAAGAWFLMDFAYYGNTISSPLILKSLDPAKAISTDVLLQLAIFVVAAAPGYALAVFTLDRLGRKRIQIAGFLMMTLAFGAIGLIPGISSMVVPFLLLFGLSYFFTEFGPNTTTFIYPAEIFPTRVRTTGHGIAAAAGKMGAFVGVFLFPYLLSDTGLAGAELVAAAVSLLGLMATIVLLPEPSNQSLEELGEELAA